MRSGASHPPEADADQGAGTRPLWRATVPSARRRQVTSTSPARRIVTARSRGRGKPSSEVGQVAVRVAVAGEPAEDR